MYKVQTEDGLDEELLLLHQPRQGRRLRLRRVPRDLGHRFRHSVHRRVPAGNNKQVKSYLRWVEFSDSFHIKHLILFSQCCDGHRLHSDVLCGKEEEEVARPSLPRVLRARDPDERGRGGLADFRGGRHDLETICVGILTDDG